MPRINLDVPEQKISEIFRERGRFHDAGDFILLASLSLPNTRRSEFSQRMKGRYQCELNLDPSCQSYGTVYDDTSLGCECRFRESLIFIERPGDRLELEIVKRDISVGATVGSPVDSATIK